MGVFHLFQIAKIVPNRTKHLICLRFYTKIYLKVSFEYKVSKIKCSSEKAILQNFHITKAYQVLRVFLQKKKHEVYC